MKLCIVGGGGFRVPLVYGALLRRQSTLDVEEIVLHDVDEARLQPHRRRARRAWPPSTATSCRSATTTDLDDAVEGADFVFSAIRVGELQGRVVDETVPLSCGVLGQETTGPGGICFALRTIPSMIELAEVDRRAARPPPG